MPQTNGIPPVNGPSSMPPYDNKGMTVGNGSPSPNASGSPGVANSGTYPITDAQKGFACPPTIDGYGCNLRFNLPPPTPTPAPASKNAKSKKATPAPSPTPTDTPTPSPSGSGSPSSTPKPTPTPASISLKVEAAPKDAPALVHIPAGSLSTVPLMMVHLTPTGDLHLDGWAEADFTLPKSEVAERGFAVQLFKANVGKHSTSYNPIWTFDKSTLNDTTLTFSFQPPKMTIPKGGTYVLVLYGDDKSKASPAPVPTGTAPSSAAPATEAPTSEPTGQQP